jgi:hypothetical protein
MNGIIFLCNISVTFVDSPEPASFLAISYEVRVNDAHNSYDTLE